MLHYVVCKELSFRLSYTERSLGVRIQKVLSFFPLVSFFRVRLGLGLGRRLFVSSFSVLRGCPSRWYDLGTTMCNSIKCKINPSLSSESAMAQMVRLRYGEFKCGTVQAVFHED